MKTRLLTIIGIVLVVGVTITLGANLMSENAKQREIELNQSHLVWDTTPESEQFKTHSGLGLLNQDERESSEHELEVESKHFTVEELLIENQIDYHSDQLVITSGPTIKGDPGCGAVIDTTSNTHWFRIDSVSNPVEMTLYSDNPNQCIVNTSSCFCNAQIELASLTLDDLVYFSSEEQEKYVKTLIGYLYEENINKTPKFQIGKQNINYTDSSAIGYCGQIWGTNTYGFFSGAIVNEIVEDYKISKDLPLLCAISNDAKWWENEN